MPRNIYDEDHEAMRASAREFVARTLAPPLGSRVTLTGRYDGATISATGKERSSDRDCTLALTRS